MKGAVAFFLLVGLSVTAANMVAAQSAVSPHIQEAIDNPQRSETDRKRDAGRRPEQVLSFIGVMPGMTVLDVFSGGGYYSEIISHLLGSYGTVIAHYTDAARAFSVEEFEARYAGGRLANVRTYKSEANDIDLEEESVDLVIFILGFHDIYYKPEKGNWPSIEAKLFMKNIYRALRAHGTFVVIDHAAAAGSPTESGNTLHRIDPEIVMSIVSTAGFDYVGSSDVLRNPDDDHTQTPFAEGMRGNTDRFIMKFRKPEGGKE